MGGMRTAQGTHTTTATLVRGLPAEPHEFMLYLPLYNGIESIEIGTLEGSTIEPAPERTDPIVFYGTSITHGACASRPGMGHPAILGRRLDRPIVNLGFSGNGRLEPEVGRFLVEIDAAVFVLDCLPNLNGDQTAARTEPMVRQIRAAHPDVPIVFMTGHAPNPAGLPGPVLRKPFPSRELAGLLGATLKPGHSGHRV